jgi:hypothetical protein
MVAKLIFGISLLIYVIIIMSFTFIGATCRQVDANGISGCGQTWNGAGGLIGGAISGGILGVPALIPAAISYAFI